MEPDQQQQHQRSGNEQLEQQRRHAELQLLLLAMGLEERLVSSLSDAERALMLRTHLTIATPEEVAHLLQQLGLPRVQADFLAAVLKSTVAAPGGSNAAGGPLAAVHAPAVNAAAAVDSDWQEGGPLAAVHAPAVNAAAAVDSDWQEGGPLAAVHAPAVNAAAAVDSDWQEGARTGLSLAVLLLLAMALLADGIPRVHPLLLAFMVLAGTISAVESNPRTKRVVVAFARVCGLARCSTSSATLSAMVAALGAALAVTVAVVILSAPGGAP
ncbi:hypothetical protein HXX76_014296 [Chlamydomonas incerta]|uniref:Uncharacterized protein n=1 Tax=Chlamydomonas incerta TaxID=51695 RepID=A0A835VR60_CHLIN|nr:hypothetical protein HXX76_014296 [Chlamydomonas incerta]|eukprot:KAG2424720.1 hypothetical protein HXX76_014296 [Chlamydomonas incerta]